MVIKSALLLSAALKAINAKTLNKCVSAQLTSNTNVLLSDRLVNKTENIQLSDAFNSTNVNNDDNNHVSKEKFLQDMLVFDDFLSKSDEEALLAEIEPYLKRLRYEFDHWDDAIHGYRETERLHWNKENSLILQRVRNIAFPPGTAQLAHVHVLDLASNGFIKPHIDAVRFCGTTIAGLSLLSDSVMRLVHDKNKLFTADILLKRRSLYIMKNTARFEYTHEILGDKDSKFDNKKISRERRISIICRNEPSTDFQD